MFRTASLKPFEQLNAKGLRRAAASFCFWASTTIAFGLLLSLFACSSPQKPAALPYYNTPDFSPHFISKAEALKTVTHTLAPFSFQNQNGQTVSNQTIAGKIHVAAFMFTACGSICPKMTNNLKMVSKAFAADSGVVLLSYSVTPWIDTKERLKAYKEANGIANRNWHFLTGDKAAVYTLARRSYFAEEDLGFTRDSTVFLHTEHLVLVDGSGRLRGVYNGTLQLDLEQLIEDVTVLKTEE